MKLVEPGSWNLMFPHSGGPPPESRVSPHVIDGQWRDVHSVITGVTGAWTHTSESYTRVRHSSILTAGAYTFVQNQLKWCHDRRAELI